MASTFEDDVMVKDIGSLGIAHKPSAETHTQFIESLHLEDTAELLAMMRVAIDNAPETNQAAIDTVKTELSNDKYQIQSKSIAAKLVAYNLD